ncbi:TonB-dependent receptor [bacterium]|nr:TonB-dependent receptor [bacterium]
MRNRVLMSVGLMLSAVAVGFAVPLAGTVTNGITGKPLANASVVLTDSPVGTATAPDGSFTLNVQPVAVTIRISHVGYAARVVTASPPFDQALTIALQPAPEELSTVVVTAGRTEQLLHDVPATVSVVPRERIEREHPSSVDDLLRGEAGVDVRRTGGLYTMSPSVTLRGTGANEPSRTLVMVDGMPINKGDTGEVNWNRISPDDLERIEIVRGPASALYGAGAMGGVINLITRTPRAGYRIHGYGEGGSYGTFGGGFNATYGRALSDGSSLDAFLSYRGRQSDGYVSTPPEQRNEYTTERFLEENAVSAKLGYRRGAQRVEAMYQRYDDQRGEGEKIQAPDGEYRDFDTDFIGLNYHGASGRTAWKGNAWYQKEQYGRIDERMRNGDYSRFDVLSDRIDYGGSSQFTWKGRQAGTWTVGLEARLGSVDGADVYRTSPDVVANEGELLSYAGFLQNSYTRWNDRLRLSAGVRYDVVRFRNGFIRSTLAPWDAYSGALEENQWSALSPRFGVTLRFKTHSSVYASVGQAFRASILDDLCRSGWMWVGPKIANPELEPETMTTVEAGGRHAFGRNWLSLAGYYSIGNDFLYYVNTDQTIFGGAFTLRQRQNVAEVRLYGVEGTCRYRMFQSLFTELSGTLSQSEISEFHERPELEGHPLDYSPSEKGSLGLVWDSRFHLALMWELIGDQEYVNGQDERITIKGYGLLHASVDVPVGYGFRAGVDAQNLFNREYTQSEISLDPGRFVMARLSYTLDSTEE